MGTILNQNQLYLMQDDTIKIISSALNNIDDLKSTLIFVITNIKILTNCEAIGIRLHNEGDYPYYVYEGFTNDFIIKENSLCVNNELVRDLDEKRYLLECMCGDVIRGRFNPKLNFFTEHGSFVANSTSELLRSTSEDDRQGKTQNYCNSCGYESVALIPIKSKNEVIGLIQLNDMKKGMFTEELINYLQMLGENIGLAIENCFLRNKIKDAESLFEINLNKQKMQEDFLTNITHEFRTPVTVIDSAIQAIELMYKNKLPETMLGYLDKIKNNSNRQLKLINNLIDITSISTGNMKIVRVNSDIVSLTKKIIDNVKIFAEQKGINLTLSSTFNKKVMGIDKGIYKRILLNLISNALKFTPEGKQVDVKLTQKVVEGNPMLCLKVIDNGIGIPNDKLSLVFEKFEQVDRSITRLAEGAGVGLYLVKIFSDMLEGEIFLESKEGVGSIFTILLPITRVKEAIKAQTVERISTNQLKQMIAVEFSDINI